MKILFSLSLMLSVLFYSSRVATSQEAVMSCFSDTESIREALRKYEEEKVFSGLSKEQVPIELWASDNSYTIFFYTPDGRWCTFPGMSGHTIQIKKGLKI